MYAAWSAGLLAATVLSFAWAYGAYRRPDPKPWTEIELLSTIVVLGIVTLFTFSLAFVVMFLANLDAETRYVEDLGALVVSVAFCWFLAPRLMAPARKAPSAGTSVVEMPGQTPPPKSPSSSGSKRAA